MRWSSLTVLLCMACSALAQPATPQAPAPAAALNETRVEAALTVLRADPELGAQYQMRTLRWAHRNADQNGSAPAWLLRIGQWIGTLWGILASGTRVVIVSLGILAVACLVVWLLRWWRARPTPVMVKASTAPAYVLGLDIRPQSLPADVGATALALLNAGDVRAALTLLYRGLISRLVHDRGIAIADASTEGECLQLASAALPAAPLRYTRSLIQQWQRTMYAAQDPDRDALVELCNGFTMGTQT